MNGVPTNYRLDLAAGLTQVLADGTNTYLYGVNRIAQSGISDTEYFLGDALGGVRQLVDAEGDVTLAHNYQPYGEVLRSVGEAESDYGFTGEWTDSYIKFVYLRSRWYSPQIGRFTTKDSWQGDYTRPLSLNNWLYTLANPVNLNDPSGLSPIDPHEPLDHRDLTLWLYEEMSANANGYYAQRMQSMLNSSDLTLKARAVLGWIYLVKDKAKWDFKHKVSKETGGKSVLLHSGKGSAWYEYSVPGNIHYGFVGRAAGFSGFMLHTGAGYAEVIDPAHEERGEACCPEICRDLVEDPWITVNVCLPLGCYYFNPDWISSLFDDPGDYWNVEFGVKLYDTYHSQMTYEQFQKHLAVYGGWLTPAPLIPDSRFEHPDWPYAVGYFDGPDTGKNKPIVDVLLWRFPFGD